MVLILKFQQIKNMHKTQINWNLMVAPKKIQGNKTYIFWVGMVVTCYILKSRNTTNAKISGAWKPKPQQANMVVQTH